MINKINVVPQQMVILVLYLYQAPLIWVQTGYELQLQSIGIKFFVRYSKILRLCESETASLNCNGLPDQYKYYA